MSYDEWNAHEWRELYNEPKAPRGHSVMLVWAEPSNPAMPDYGVGVLSVAHVKSKTSSHAVLPKLIETAQAMMDEQLGADWRPSGVLYELERKASSSEARMSATAKRRSGE